MKADRTEILRAERLQKVRYRRSLKYTCECGRALYYRYPERETVADSRVCLVCLRYYGLQLRLDLKQ